MEVPDRAEFASDRATAVNDMSSGYRDVKSPAESALQTTVPTFKTEHRREKVVRDEILTSPMIETRFMVRNEIKISATVPTEITDEDDEIAPEEMNAKHPISRSEVNIETIAKSLEDAENVLR